MNTVLTVAGLALLAGILVSNLILLMGLARARRKAREVEDAFRSFVSAPNPQTPSPLAQTVDQVAQLCARAVIAQAQTTLMGMNSGAARAARSAEAQAALSRFPWLAALNTFAPGISKSLFKNPALLNFAGNALGKAGASPAPRSNGQQEQAPMNFGTIGGD